MSKLGGLGNIDHDSSNGYEPVWRITLKVRPRKSVALCSDSFENRADAINTDSVGIAVFPEFGLGLPKMGRGNGIVESRKLRL